MKILSVGATGSVGRLVVAEIVRGGHESRALVRAASKAARLDPQAEIVVGDLTDAGSLPAAVDGVDAVIFTHGARPATAETVEAVDYGAVRAVLEALGDRPAKIVLMTMIGVTHRASSYNRSTGAQDWKRRSERLVRASGRPYTIVRPGWFDYNEPDEHQVVLLQGDTRHAGDPSDGAISRQQLAQVLVASASSAAADRRTFELVAERGPAQTDLDALFSATRPDAPGAIDGVLDPDNMPLDEEPQRVRDDLARV